LFLSAGDLGFPASIFDHICSLLLNNMVTTLMKLTSYIFLQN